jgi:hypothetical protein
MRKPVLVFIGLLFTVQAIIAQDNPALNIKHRLLMSKRDDDRLDEKIDSFSNLHLMVAGNIYKTEKQVNIAFDPSKGRYDFTNEFKYIQPILNLGHITIANLKTSFADDPKSQYSAPDEFALAIKYAGITVACNANAQTSYVEKKSLKRTQEILSDMDIRQTGAFTDNLQRGGNYPLLVEKKGFKVAILNYATLGNRPSISRDFVINETDKALIERDMRTARALHSDFTIVYFDWGGSLQQIPSFAQQQLARFVFEAGGNLVVGTHPNAPMQIDKIDYWYGGIQREGIIAYSLGNLVSSSEEASAKTGFVIDMEVKKNNYTGNTFINDWGVIPVYNYYDTSTTPGKTKLFVLPCSAVENGEVFSNIPYIEKRRVVNGAYEVRKLMGASADEIQYNLTEIVVNNVQESIGLTNASLNNKYSQKKLEDIKKSAPPVVKDKPKIENDTIYKIQFYALKKPIPIDTNYYDHLKGYEIVEEDGYFKYLVGANKNYDEVYKLWYNQMRPRYRGSYIVAYVKGQRVKNYAP